MLFLFCKPYTLNFVRSASSVGITLIKTEDPVRQNLANSKGETKELPGGISTKKRYTFFFLSAGKSWNEPKEKSLTEQNVTKKENLN